ncbi:MAG: [NiFe]-hydrogenase assembly chaperone HybE [Pseudomonadota bacterium]
MSRHNAEDHAGNEADILRPRASMQCRICWAPYTASDADGVPGIDLNLRSSAASEGWTCPNCEAPKPRVAKDAIGAGTQVSPGLAALIREFRTDFRPDGPAAPDANPALSVAAVGTRLFQGRPVCVLVTPWFMSIVVLPAAGEDWGTLTPGACEHLAFPSGRYEFLHDRAGPSGFKSCCIFSDMAQFASQAVAIAVAERLVSALLAPDEMHGNSATQPEVELAAIIGG